MQTPDPPNFFCAKTTTARRGSRGRRTGGRSWPSVRESPWVVLAGTGGGCPAAADRRSLAGGCSEFPKRPHPLARVRSHARPFKGIGVNRRRCRPWQSREAGGFRAAAPTILAEASAQASVPGRLNRPDNPAHVVSDRGFGLLSESAKLAHGQHTRGLGVSVGLTPSVRPLSRTDSRSRSGRPHPCGLARLDPLRER